MDIRTKLVLAFLGVSLASMAALGWASYLLAGNLLRESALQGLNALAESRQHSLQEAAEGWRDRTLLIASRTQLRLSLERYLAEGGADDRAVVERILEDVIQSVRAVRGLTVSGPDGAPIAWAGSEAPDTLTRAEQRTSTGVVLDTLLLGRDGMPQVVLTTPLSIEQRTIGWLVVRFVAEELLEIGSDTTGLGRTGETVVTVADPPNHGIAVNRLRHRPETGPFQYRFEVGPSGGALGLALMGPDTIAAGLIDYRGSVVWAAARSVPEVGLGVVVKRDAEEAMEPVRALRSRLLRIGIALSAFGVVAGTLLGFRFSTPIQRLAAVAERIRTGDLEARAAVHSEDEVGLLAETFNEMAETLIDSNRALKRRIQEVTGSSPSDTRGEGEP